MKLVRGMRKGGTLTVLSWNFERNGADDPAKRLRAHQLLVSLTPHLVFRQEMWGADANGKQIMYELEDVLGLRGWLGPRASTAVFADPGMFQPLREWPDVGPMWVQAPTALTLRFAPAGTGSMPMAVASYHLNYASAANRLSEAEWLTVWADKSWTTPDGETVRMPALLAGDNNSYPVPVADEDVPLPGLRAIADRPHRLHRSFVGPSGRRVMDTRPDEVMRTAGLEDVARHWSLARDGNEAALARTVDACETHGPDSRIDRIYASSDLLPAVVGVDVVEVPKTDSDHHIVRLKLDAEHLVDILNRQPVKVAVPGEEEHADHLFGCPETVGNSHCSQHS
ncbi:endonuclease/exonuclease/phosphatase family protein [Streptomyces lydicus]|uniref:endonuclease/exonuclease/phosphatase family protein n=1 Tax=Streptomyces lydicus TaxID=47763 RepID=UPI00379FBD3F